MVYFHQFGDMERLHKIFPVLCSYYKWLKLNRTWRNGMYWSSGWGTGMDNMPRVPSEYSMIFSHGHMIWLDTNLQQLFIANLLLEMGFYLERWQEIEEFEDEVEHLKKYIRENLWDEETGFLYDQYADGSLCKTKGIGAYWALYSDVLNDDQTKRLVKELDNPATFKRTHRVPSLSADNARYKANGRYWQGGVWPGTNYMVMTGLKQKGFDKEAREIALNHYDQVFQVYKKTNTFFEYYAPESTEPGFMARRDFIGWTGLAPIAELIEFIIGIRGDYTNKKIVWDMNLTEANGIERYPFGPEGLITLKANGRRSAADKPKIEVESNVDFQLVVRYGDKEEIFQVVAGKNNF
jgi:glycogen debranching enzyme